MIENQIIETIQNLNKQYGRELTLDELLKIEEQTHIFNRIAANNNWRQGLNKFMLVHVTNYTPTENQIKTPLQTGQSQKEKIPIGETEMKSFRDSIHFTVNTTVSSHGGGDWSERKYAVFIPMDSFVEKNGQRIKSCQVTDFFMVGSTNLPDNAYLLCPQTEIKEIKEKNPNINVIGYQGQNVMPYTQKFLKMLEVSQKEYGPWSYADYNEKDFHTQKELQTMLAQKLGKTIPNSQHCNTIEHKKETTIAEIDYVLTNVANIKNGSLLNKLPKEEIEKYLMIGTVPGLGWYWKSNDSSKEEMQELANQINKLCIPLGISVLQDYRESPKKEERIYESLKIDEFINKDIDEIYEEDMLVTNIKRIEMILNKIDNENLYKDANALNILKAAINHLKEDYKITLETTDIRKKYDDKFNLRDYQKELDNKLMPLGITHKYLDKENLQEIIMHEHKNKQFIIKNIEPFKDDYILNILSTLNNLDKLISERFQIMVKNNLNEDEIFSQAYNIYGHLAKKIEMDLDEDYIVDLKKNGGNVEAYIMQIEQMLNIFGVSINDFVNKEKQENSISNRITKQLEKKLDMIEKEELNKNNNNEVIEANANKR